MRTGRGGSVATGGVTTGWLGRVGVGFGPVEQAASSIAAEAPRKWRRFIEERESTGSDAGAVRGSIRGFRPLAG
ncbi:hypothetical protein D3C87_1235190 [compost metagenome]